MILGLNYYYKCPECGSILFKESLVSSNTFGARYFSDGKVIAPNQPEFPQITKCFKCDTIFWLFKENEVGTSYGNSKESELENAIEARFLSLDEYFIALKNGIVKSDTEEYYVRQKILWLYNDRLRDGQPLFTDKDDKGRWRENIVALINVLNSEDANDKTIMAELYRNLENFDKCIEIINSIKEKELDWFKEDMIKACMLKNPLVIEFIEDADEYVDDD
ncbi:MAG: hypothetical protein PHW82_05620 [Bacteroidales bacterium]|nr:hypothetical protein [Bacteroidales bacterium]